MLWDLTLLFLILGTIYFVCIFFFRNKISGKALKTKKKRQELAPVISNFLFHSTDDPREEQKQYIELKIEIREYLNDPSFRKIISQILFDLQKDVAGDTRERLFKLYKELGLHHDSFKKLESWRWETVSQGILELSQMEVDESYQLIRKFINDRRGVVRKQAELATVSLKEDGINYLLDATKHPISEWQQLKLIEKLSKRENYRPPHFKGWLLSQNKDVVLFALRLIKHYNQQGAESSIKELVKHKNDEIKIAAIQCIVDFNFKSAVRILKQVFWKSTNAVKISVLNAIAGLGTEDDLLFLQEVAAKESSFVIVGKAQSSINTIAPETILPSKDIMQFKEDTQSVPQEDIILDEATKAFEVITESVEVPASETLEVEDLEFYDEVEFSNTKEETAPAEVPAFELSLLEEEEEDSVGQELGLIASDELEVDTTELFETYTALSTSEKMDVVSGLTGQASDKDRSLLEQIAENETDSELRFHAFQNLKNIKKETPESEVLKEEEGSDAIQLPLPQQSIFYPLYHYATDLDAKIILLQELMVVGDERELPFLESLKEVKEAKIVSVVEKAIAHIQSETAAKTSKPVTQESTPEILVKEHSEPNPSVIPAQEITEADDRIPMELFMLYEEMGIGQALEEERIPFDFELSHEYFLNLDSQVKGSDE